jgi:hypothetical protein
MRSSSLLLATGLLVAGAGTAAAGEDHYFQTPSGNISCAYDEYEGTPNIRCDIRNYTPTMGPPPADCDLDWGGAFAIGAGDNEAVMLCHGDTVAVPGAAVLSYGRSFKRGGIACLSEKRGLTCQNRKGHGFFLSRASQELF